MNVSVLILTLNEESNLPGCLESVAWSDDIVVFDSYSSDRTVEITKAAGARVIQRKFDNYATQRNAALNEVEYKNPWILMIDADERVLQELETEIKQLLSSGDAETTLYRMRRKDFLFGRWLRYSSGYPTWFGKFFRAGNVTVVREINEEYHTKGKIGYLREHLIHYPFNKGIAFWFERHNRYSSMEAEALVKEVQGKLRFEDLFSSDPTIRRKFLKQVVFHLPCRPFVVFCYLYFVKLGFLDGMPGFTYCRLRAIYEYMIDFKVKELRRHNKGLPI
jgi:glycosyltransferase involved in cell wall biosynthesis